MKHALFGARALALGMVVAGILTAPAYAGQPVSVDTSWCTNPLLSQPFLSSGDSNMYALVPGQGAGGFDGTGWTLSGGAKIVTSTLADGTTGSVLDLPSGAAAISPTICVTSAYPTARMRVRDVAGSAGVSFYVSYDGTKTWKKPLNTGQVQGNGTAWTLANPVDIEPSTTPGWQPVRFMLQGGKKSESDVYALYVDPRMIR